MERNPQGDADASRMNEESVEQVDNNQTSPGNSMEESERIKLQDARIEEQTSVICILKKRADEMLLRYQALQKINLELEDQVSQCQTKLDVEKRRTELLEKKFSDLAANNQAILTYLEEHKKQNAELKLENKQLKIENDSLFSQKLYNREMLIDKLSQDVKLLKETCAKSENEYRAKLDGYELKFKEQNIEFDRKETSLLHQLSIAQHQYAEAVEKCKELKLELEDVKEKQALKEISLNQTIMGLNNEKATLLNLSIERGKLIQEKQVEIHQLEAKCKEERKAKIAALERFKREEFTVNKDTRVTSLQADLKESMARFENLTKEFETFRDQAVTLLAQEKELNKKLRHMNA